MNICSYLYLNKILDNRKAYIFDNELNLLSYVSNNLNISDIKEETIEENEIVDEQIKEEITINSLPITDNYVKSVYTSQAEIIEEPVIDNSYVEIEYSEVNNTEITPTNIPEQVIQDNYCNVYNTHFSYPVNTSIDTIINDIVGSIDSNSKYSIDYYSLNPNITGSYTVFITGNNINHSITVDII